ncbi:MAG: GH36-type glycosyl hydrolase domain-containing protein [Bacillota bacterium]
MSTIGKYGRFIEEEACFELVGEPPRKWVNLHCNKIGDDEYYSEMTNIGDGWTWARDKDGVTCLLVNWDNKYLYIRDDESGTVFCPGGAPAPQKVADFSCKYYAAKTVITGTCEGLKATQRVFVPKDYAMEIWTLHVENKTDRPRKLSVFGYAMFQLTGCDKEGRGLWKDNYAVVYPEIGGVLVTNRNTKLPTDKFKGFLSALNGFKAGNGYRDHFTRSEFSMGTPRILWGWNCDNRPGYGPDCAGIVQVSLEIAAESTGRVDFLLGQTSSLEQIKQIRAGLTPEKIDQLCAEQESMEKKRAESFRIDLGNPNYNGLMNYFVKKQIYTYLINKSGFRDNLQADYALAMIDYPAAEANFLRALSSQSPDGKVIHGFRPLNRLQYSDKPAWIFLTAPGLIKESGDFSMLEKVVPYFESSEKGTVWDHMVRTMRYLANDTGKHGLCRQHHADWNDGLEATPETGERESVMVTQQFCYGLLEMEELANRTGQNEIAGEARRLYEIFKQRLNDVAWDGEWYVRFICEDGYKVGSKNNFEGKILINSQSWAVLSQTASPDRAVQCMDSLEKMLGAECGYRLVAPGFSKYDPRIGQMSNSMPGHAENGGCYNHAAGFKAVADCMLGRAEKAWETWVKVAPDNPANPITQSTMEPFSFTNMFSTVPYIYGQAGYPWRTGTAAWFTVLLVEWILGARRSYDGLLIDPCLSSKVPKAKILRTFRGAQYDIELDNTAGRGKGVQSITVDGKRIEGNVLPVFTGGVHEVKAVI